MHVRSTSAIALLLALGFSEFLLFAKEDCVVALASSRLSLAKAFDELENYFIGEPDL